MRDELRRARERRGLRRTEQNAEETCPRCARFPGRIVFQGEGSGPPCPKCLELREELPPSMLPPIQTIEFRDNTRSREEAREALDQLHYERRRTQALAAVGGDAEAMKRAEADLAIKSATHVCT